MAQRPNEVRVTLSDDELALLDEQRPRGVSRPAYVRSLLREPPDAAEVASRDEALSILTSLARDGRVSAAIALARELREGDTAVSEADELTKFDQLARRGSQR